MKDIEENLERKWKGRDEKARAQKERPQKETDRAK